MNINQSKLRLVQRQINPVKFYHKYLKDSAKQDDNCDDSFNSNVS